jgi:hypothetical protein
MDSINSPASGPWRALRVRRILAAAALASGLPAPAHASIFRGETLDKIANALAGIVLFIAPVIGTRTSHETPRGFS